MAAWVDKGEDEGWQAVPEVDRGKQEGRDERDEGERGNEDRSLNQSLFGFNNCMNAHLHQKLCVISFSAQNNLSNSKKKKKSYAPPLPKSSNIYTNWFWLILAGKVLVRAASAQIWSIQDIFQALYWTWTPEGKVSNIHLNWRPDKSRVETSSSYRLTPALCCPASVYATTCC